MWQDSCNIHCPFFSFLPFPSLWSIIGSTCLRYKNLWHSNSRSAALKFCIIFWDCYKKHPEVWRLNNDLQKNGHNTHIYWVCNRFITLQLSKIRFYHFTSDMSLFTISSAVYSSISVFVTCLICFFFRCRYTNSRKIV